MRDAHMGLVPWSDINNPVKSVTDSTINLASKVADSVCQVYANYPDTLLLPGTPGDGIRRLVLDTACSPRAKPPGALAPVGGVGGQCDCTRYSVSFTQRQTSSGTGANTTGTVSSAFPDVFGPVGRPFIAGTNSSGFIVRLPCKGVGTGTCGSASYVDATIGRSYSDAQMVITGSTNTLRFAGTDTCGASPPPSSPPAPPGTLTPTVNINLTPYADINIPITITPTANINAPIIIAGAGVSLQLGLGGIHIDPPTTGTGTSDECCFSDTDRDLLKRIHRQTRRRVSLSAPELTSTIVRPSVSSADYTLTGIIDYVCIEFTQLPIASKVQYGGGVAPDSLYSGWFAWKFGTTNYSEKIPISFEKTVFQSPIGAIGYAYTCTNRSVAKAIEYYRKNDDPI